MYVLVSLVCAFDPGPDEEYCTTSNSSWIWYTCNYTLVVNFVHTTCICAYLLPTASWSQCRRMSALSPCIHIMPPLLPSNLARYKLGELP